MNTTVHIMWISQFGSKIRLMSTKGKEKNSRGKKRVNDQVQCNYTEVLDESCPVLR